MGKRFLVKYGFLILYLFSITCVRRITPPIREGMPVLVVEGLVTTDSIPYTVKLSYTGKFLNASSHIDSNQNYINDAKVVIKDDAGDSSSCNLISPGTYQTSDSGFIGTVGRTYTLEIYLSNGETFISSAEKINPVPAIDSITAVYDSTYITDVRPTQLIVSVNTHDQPGVQNFYRWTAYGYTPRKSWGGPCTIGSPPCTDPYMCTCFALCEQYLTDNQLNILSDQYIDGREIIQPAFYSPVYWFGKHFIEIKQYSMNKDIYLFWQQYLQQTNRTGSILDPLPASLIGNIHNLSDSNNVALGYFETSAVITKKVIIVPFFLQEYLLASIAGSYILMGDCHGVYRNSLADDQDAPGWENAQTIEMH
ncbi:MAG TPA: DUF4249 domain-containing protein [Puia sp.]|nr:DUF4249 domain-containing protein [Puia sp.]